MAPRIKQWLSSALAMLGALPLVALYLALSNGFADVIGTIGMGAVGLASTLLVSVPATVYGAALIRRHPGLPKSFTIASGLFAAMVCLSALVFLAVAMRGDA